MAIPICRMQACGRFHVPRVREPVTGYLVRHALGLLDPMLRLKKSPCGMMDAENQ